MKGHNWVRSTDRDGVSTYWVHCWEQPLWSYVAGRVFLRLSRAFPYRPRSVWLWTQVKAFRWDDEQRVHLARIEIAERDFLALGGRLR